MLSFVATEVACVDQPDKDDAGDGQYLKRPVKEYATDKKDFVLVAGYVAGLAEYILHVESHLEEIKSAE